MQSANLSHFSLEKFVWKGLTLTDSAAKQIKILSANNQNIKGILLDIKKSGCAGFSYTMSLVKEPEKNNLLFTHLGAILYVPLHAMPFIDGTEVDFVRKGLNQAFTFNNPKAQYACGCGESFSVE